MLCIFDEVAFLDDTVGRIDVRNARAFRDAAFLRRGLIVALSDTRDAAFVQFYDAEGATTVLVPTNRLRWIRGNEHLPPRDKHLPRVTDVTLPDGQRIPLSTHVTYEPINVLPLAPIVVGDVLRDAHGAPGLGVVTRVGSTIQVILVEDMHFLSCVPGDLLLADPALLEACPHGRRYLEADTQRFLPCGCAVEPRYGEPAGHVGGEPRGWIVWCSVGVTGSGFTRGEAVLDWRENLAMAQVASREGLRIPRSVRYETCRKTVAAHRARRLRLDPERIPGRRPWEVL